MGVVNSKRADEKKSTRNSKFDNSNQILTTALAVQAGAGLKLEHEGLKEVKKPGELALLLHELSMTRVTVTACNGACTPQLRGNGDATQLSAEICYHNFPAEI